MSRCRQQKRKNANRDIDEENPAPAKVVGDPTAERGADGRSHHYGNAVNGECHAALGVRKGIDENGLRARLQASAARALKNAEDDQHGEIGRESAEKRTDRKHRDTAHVKTLAAHDRRQPAAQRQHDGIGDEIRRQVSTYSRPDPRKDCRQHGAAPHWRCWCRAPP